MLVTIPPTIFAVAVAGIELPETENVISGAVV
jgi:hypothetical protein